MAWSQSLYSLELWQQLVWCLSSLHMLQDLSAIRYCNTEIINYCLKTPLSNKRHQSESIPHVLSPLCLRVVWCMCWHHLADVIIAVNPQNNLPTVHPCMTDGPIQCIWLKVSLDYALLQFYAKETRTLEIAAKLNLLPWFDKELTKIFEVRVMAYLLKWSVLYDHRWSCTVVSVGDL